MSKQETCLVSKFFLFITSQKRFVNTKCGGWGGGTTQGLTALTTLAATQIMIRLEPITQQPTGYWNPLYVTLCYSFVLSVFYTGLK